jgi:hypothetical protein
MHKLNEDMIRREADAPATGLAAVYAARQAMAERNARLSDQAGRIGREAIHDANLQLGTMTGALQIIAEYAESWGWDAGRIAEYAADVLTRAEGK